MKRLIAAGVLTVIIAIIHFGGTTYIKKVIDQSNYILADCVSEYESNLNPEAKAQKLQKYWSDQEGFLSVFAHGFLTDFLVNDCASMAIMPRKAKRKMMPTMLLVAVCMTSAKKIC